MPLWCLPHNSPMAVCERGTGRLVRTYILLPPRTPSELAKTPCPPAAHMQAACEEALELERLQADMLQADGGRADPCRLQQLQQAQQMLQQLRQLLTGRGGGRSGVGGEPAAPSSSSLAGMKRLAEGVPEAPKAKHAAVEAVGADGVVRAARPGQPTAAAPLGKAGAEVHGAGKAPMWQAGGAPGPHWQCQQEAGNEGHHTDVLGKHPEQPTASRSNLRLPAAVLPPQWTSPSAGSVAGTLGRCVFCRSLCSGLNGGMPLVQLLCLRAVRVLYFSLWCAAAGPGGPGGE